MSGETASRRRRVLAAVVLAGVAPPGGHVFLGRSRRGFLLLAASVAAAVAWVGLAPRSFFAATIGALPALLLLLAVIVDAGLLARRSPETLPPRPLHRWWVYVLLALVTQLALPDALYRLTRSHAGILHQPDAAMEPTLLEGEAAVFLRHPPALERVARGELVVVADPGEGPRVRRVAGLPGETVEVRQGRVLLDGRDWIEDRLRVRRRPDLELEPRDVPSGSLLVLGDRRRSSDPLQGPVSYERILGRPTWVVLPPGFPFDPGLGVRLGEELR